MRGSIKYGFKIDGMLCSGCKVKMDPIAHDTGDGWWLGYECPDCGDVTPEDGLIEWPFSCETATAKMLEDVGFLIV